MKKITTYKWEAEDASLEFVEAAFNRLRNFLREGDECEEGLLKAFRRVTRAGETFSADDVTFASRLIDDLAERAAVAANDDGRMGYAANADAIRQAAANGHAAARELRRMFTLGLSA
jgi:hypothetical protein